jgi:peptidoglycan hydrolase CwlO-like protein
MDEHTQALVELNSKLERLLSGIEVLGANQERMSEDISKIKEAVYNPDEGLYARLRAIEQWKESTTRIQWMIISVVVMMAMKQIWEIMMVSN